jgi:hypothetical protein
MSFILLRHLSHAFNFIIYFTSSSVIKQQLREILAEHDVRNVTVRGFLRCVKSNCCCLVRIKGGASGASTGAGAEDTPAGGAQQDRKSTNRSKSTTNNRTSGGENFENDSLLVEMNERVAKNKINTSTAISVPSSTAAAQPAKLSYVEIETARYYEAMYAASNEKSRMSNVQRKISYKRKIRNLKRHSMLSLKSLSSLSDLRGYYSSARSFLNDEDDSNVYTTVVIAKDANSIATDVVLPRYRSTASVVEPLRPRHPATIVRRRTESIKRKRPPPLTSAATVDSSNGGGSHSVTFAVPSLQVNSQRVSIKSATSMRGVL